MQSLYAIKHDPILADGQLDMKADDVHDVATILYRKEGRTCVGVFSLMANEARVPVPAADGVYQNRVDGSAVTVENGELIVEGGPVVFDC